MHLSKLISIHIVIINNVIKDGIANFAHNIAQNNLRNNIEHIIANIFLKVTIIKESLYLKAKNLPHTYLKSFVFIV